MLLQVVHQSMATGLRTYCVEYNTDRGICWETARDRLKLEVSAPSDPDTVRLTLYYARARP